MTQDTDRKPQQQSDPRRQQQPGQQNQQGGDRGEHVPTRPAEETGVGRDRARPDIAQGIDTGAMRPGVTSDGDAQDI